MHLVLARQAVNRCVPAFQRSLAKRHDHPLRRFEPGVAVDDPAAGPQRQRVP
jgi:hypothetical protein